MAATERARPQREALPPEENLSREAERGPRAGYAALAAGLLVIAGGIALQSIYSDIPRVPVLDALRDVAGQSLGRPGLMSDKVLFYDDKSLSLILVSVVQALGALCTGFVLVHLYDAAAGRGSTVPRLAKLVAMFGAVATALGFVALQVVAAILSHDFASGSDHSTQAAHDALRSGVLVAAQFIGFLGTLCLALGFIMIALNAMRVGLLTRFLGILGMLVGVLLVIPVGSPVPVVQAFWMAALGVLLLGRWPGGRTPPAWETGRAEPWPTQQELREQRARARGGDDAAATPPPPGEPEVPAGIPSPATSKRKKRKRRS